MSSHVQDLEQRKLINPPRWLSSNVHYETLMGSVAYGVSSDTSDTDVYGFCIPTKELVFPHLAGEINGFGKQTKPFDVWQEHHIMDKDALGGSGRSYDIQIFSIVKYFQLAMENNPNMIDSLFTPEFCVLHSTKVGSMVRENRKMFLHKGSWQKFKGYAYSQLHKMSEPARKKVKEFEAEHGLPSSNNLEEVLEKVKNHISGVSVDPLYSKLDGSQNIVITETAADLPESKTDFLNFIKGMFVSVQPTGWGAFKNSCDEARKKNKNYPPMAKLLPNPPSKLDLYLNLLEAGNKTPIGKRKGLVEQYGFDVKFAYHVVRLLYEAEQILLECDIDLQRHREHLKSIRRGEVSEDEIRNWASEKEKALERAYETSKLQYSPDEAKIKSLLLNCLEEHYGNLDKCIVNPDQHLVALRQIQEIVSKSLNQ